MVAVAPDGASLAILEVTAAGNRVSQIDWSGQTRAELFNLPLRELVLSWPASSTLAVQTRASAAAAGLLYLYDLKTKKLTPTINNVFGLAAKLSPDGRFVAYSGLAENRVFTAIYDREDKSVARLSLTTLIEKCVWANLTPTLFCAVPGGLPSANYPDQWYQGRAALSDNFWQFDAVTKQSKLLYNPVQNNLKEEVDGFKLLTGPTDQQLYLINKNDLHLWALDLTADD